MAINFPDSPNNGDSFTSNNKTWVFDGTVWNITSGTNSVADGAITTAKLASNAVHQTKLASNLSAITVTTTANRGTDVASPFTGQTIYLSDVKRLQVWDGSAWMFVTNGAPGAPTSLSATPLSTTSVSVAFTTGTINGVSPINYKYAYSSDSGSTYSEYAALDPADIASPITISGLTGSTAYLIKLRAVSDFGDSVDSSPVSVTTLTAPSAPTSLVATGYYLSAQISFTPGADGGSAITNYEYALSTNSGATYGAFTALSPVDAASPIDITGLANNTTYSIKIRAVSANGAGIESSTVSVTTNQNITVDYLVVAGGAGAGGSSGNGTSSSGGGAGGLRSTVTATGGGGALETALSPTLSTNYSVQIGAGGAGGASRSDGGANGGNSVFSTITSTGGGGGGAYQGGASSGGSGGGSNNASGAGSGTANQGYAGGNNGSTGIGAGGGGAGAVGGNANSPAGFGGGGGEGVATSISGASVTYAGGGGGAGSGGTNNGAGGAGGGGNASGNLVVGGAGTVNTGGGGGGNYVASYNNPRAGGAGGSGVVILRYLDVFTITVGAGLTASHTNATASAGYKYTRITAGSGNVSWA